MLCFGRFRKAIYLGVHIKPSIVNRALNFFVLLWLLVFASRDTTWSQIQRPSVWVASGGASQQIPEPQNALRPDDLTDGTVRQIFHLSMGGPALRVHFSNAFGTDALHITSAHIARPLSASSSAIDPASDRPLTFAGRSEVIIPPGAELISDPV